MPCVVGDGVVLIELDGEHPRALVENGTKHERHGLLAELLGLLV